MEHITAFFTELPLILGAAAVLVLAAMFVDRIIAGYRKGKRA
ncbi:MAG: hypothetical protein ACT4O1_18205 [Gemmatimonadota bacterium]